MKHRLLALIFVFAMCLVLASCSASEKSNSEKSIVVTSSSEADQVQTQVLFESDETVNQLLCDYNDIAEYPFQVDEIKRGNIRAKAIIVSNDLYSEVVVSRHGTVSIRITSKDEENPAFYPTFRDFALALNGDITPQELEKAWEDIQTDWYEIDYNSTGINNVYDVDGVQMQYINSQNMNESTAELFYHLD